MSEPISPSPGRSGDITPQLTPRLPRSRLVRLIAIPLIAIVVGLLYYGLHDRFLLPECILKQLRLEPSRYEPIKTVSSSKTQVTCNATLPLPDGGIVVIDYSFYWQGSQANIRYSVTRK